MRIAAYIGGIGMLGPGLSNWPEAAAVLSGRGAYRSAPTVLPQPVLLPPAERRRSGRAVKLALAVASEASAHANASPAELKSVFTSSGGDGHNCHELCQALVLSPSEISPTRFSNSVHNAAAGYWSIATGSTAASTVLCAFDGSFCAGLLEALTQVVVDGDPVLLVAYDTEYPEPLFAMRPVPDAFGTSLVLTPHREKGSLARIEASLGGETIDSLADRPLEALRAAVPAARSLPLLERIAMRARGRAVLEYLDVSNVTVEVEPCD
ncbi:MAG TPA: beta-ketoacyl synthase chain length factor [Steroidobacteraceae bacterium]|nr:beta-ketoacyl synthase chain length factor [Steroidobacteraceae bacterium]